MDWSHTFSVDLSIMLFSSGFIWRSVDFVIRFCFFKTDIKFFVLLMFVAVVVVVVVWFCCSFWFAFLISAYHRNLMHQSSLHWVICFGGYLIVHTHLFFWKILGIFLFFYLFGYLLGRQLCRNCGWAGSEPHVPWHITESPCSVFTRKSKV